MSVKANVAARSQVDRWLLLVPAIAGVFFGLGPYLLAGGFGRLCGYAGNDDFLYRLAGAATIGYPFGLILGLRQSRGSALRLPALATLTFNVASLYACAVAIFGGAAVPITYLITVASALNAAIASNFLVRYPREPQPAADITPC